MIAVLTLERTPMETSLPIGSFKFTLIAETGDRFSDFTAYVASINDTGVVALQAALREGGRR